MSSATSRRKPQQSILSLDKSAEPFTVQIAQACSILEIDLDEHCRTFQKSADGPSLQQHPTYDPRAEWALRWLLKKLQSSQLSPGCPNLAPESWMMLQELAVRTPLASVARLLRAHQFTSVLRNTLGWLQQQVNRINVSRDVGDESEEMFGPLEDSSDTMENSSNGYRTSRKRKLDGTEVTVSGETVNAATGAFRLLYLAICGTVRQLQSLTMDPEQTRGFSVEHMKSSLRSSLEDAAHILGSSCYLTNRLIQTPRRHWPHKRILKKEFQKLLAEDGYTSCIFPAISLWDRRSLKGQQSSTSSNSVFLAYSMLPILQLLDTCRQHPEPNKNLAEVIKSLEALLCKYIVLPLRDSLLDPEPATEPEKEVSLSSFSDHMMSLLRDYFLQLESPFLQADWKIGKHLALSAISLLFEVAIKCRPRDTPKLRRAENPWLEKLFMRLAKCAETLFPPSPSVRAQKDHVRVLKWMLRKAVDHQVRLSLSTLHGLLDQASCLFDNVGSSHDNTPGDVEDDIQVEWGLVSLCILNDSDAFVIPSSSAVDSETYTYRSPNKYLSALLRAITDESHQISLEELKEDKNYNFKLLHIIEPLCSAFIGARDLSGFLEHWREQLDKVQVQQQTRSDCDLLLSIWEDERLLLYVAQSVESSLTVGQISRVLSTTAHDLAPPIPSLPGDQTVCLASLVIFDCISTGLSKDETFAELESIALSVFSSLGVLISRPLSASSPYDWRIWRIMATVTDHWSSLRESLAFKRKAHAAICIAFELINRISSELTINDTVDLKQELYAFKYLLKFSAMDDTFWEGLQFSSRRQILLALTKLLDLMEPFCRRISHDLFGTSVHSEPISEPDGHSFKLSPIDQVYFDSIDEILGSPDILSYLDGATQTRFLQQLYWSSVFQQRLLGSKKNLSIDYASCWEKLSQNDAFDENESMTRCLRNFQVDRYLSTSDFGEPKYWNAGDAEYVVAFRSIQATPTNYFERGQRGKLANRVLRILLLADMSKLAKTTEHLILLIKLIEIPNKSMNILTNEAEMSRKSFVQPKDEMALISLARGIDGVIGWSEDNVHCVRALRQLASSVMSYLFSTLDQKSSVQYLETFYGQMAHSLDCHYKDDRTCTVAFSALVEVTLNQFSQHRDSLPGSVKGVGLDTTRQYHLECILKSLDDFHETSLDKSEHRHNCAVNLECLAGYSDLLIIHPRLQDISGHLFGNDGPFQTLTALNHDGNLERIAMAQNDCCSMEYLAVCLAKLKLRLYAYDYNPHPDLAHVSELLNSLRSGRERKRLLQHFKDAMPSLTSHSKKALGLNFHVEQNEDFDYSQLLRTQIVISSLNEGQIQEFSDDLSRLLIFLCRGFSRRIDFHECVLSMQCVNMLLQNHTRIISQWHVDELVAAIGYKASRLRISTEKDAGRLYIGLCRLFGALLTTHRAKIGGRYHLVVLTLQTLLRCLFVPYQDNEAGGSESLVFGVRHAAAYGRILNMICDPTVSSVTRSRNRSRLELNDERKKARSIAGQHLPYLIMDFCSCKLAGRLQPGMRAALNSGLYAVLAVVSPDMMRTMNAAMDSSSRSVFKALYSDYRKSGKWNEGG